MIKPTNLLPQEGWVHYYPDFLKELEAQATFQSLLNSIPWREETIQLFGRSVMQPRQFSWHGDPDARYQYSGLKLQPEPWTPQLLDLKARIEVFCQASFNSVLLNLYRDQRDSNGWHADDEKELGAQPTIASLSLGQTRDFLLKHKKQDLGLIKLALESGSLLVMGGVTQKHWKHSLPKRSRPLGSRINLTFRQIII